MIIFDILFVIVFIVLYEVFAAIGGVIMSILPNWVVITMCEVTIGMLSAYSTIKIFEKKRVSIVCPYICMLCPIIATVLNVYLYGFNLSMIWYCVIGCVATYIGLFEL